MEFIGIDLHLKTSFACFINEDGQKVGELAMPTTESAFQRHFAHLDPARICIEAGSYSPWVNRLLKQYGHEVFVANPRKVRLIAESTLKNDRVDAEVLARLVRMDPHLLGPITPRGAASQLLRGELKVRSTLVRSRTMAINCVRGLLRGWGWRFPTGYPEKFSERVQAGDLPTELRELVEPLLESIDQLQVQIHHCDKQLQAKAESNPTVCGLQEIPGVGPIIALAFMASIDEPSRFSSSRQVGGYLGLRPKLRESGGKRQMGHITKEGDRELRALLLQGAYALMRSRKENALKKWALRLEQRIGKKKAMVALARKMAVLMHHLWVTGQVYESFPHVA